MRDLVLIPTFARPEYLHICLEHLLEAGAKSVWIAQDNHRGDSRETKHRNEESAFVAKSFSSKFEELQFIDRQPHSYTGNPYNFLELYSAAYREPGVRFVYLVEDDVLVGKDFFRWHETVQAKGDFLCSVAWHCIRNDRAIKSDDPESYIESFVDFSSIGVCWKREKLAELVKHARPEYYGNLSGYMRSHFGNSSIPFGTWTEQAGLIMRILLANENEKVAWAVRPRCAHVGISGYHRAGGFKFQGTLESRINAMRQAIGDTEKLVGLSRDTFDDVSALPKLMEWSDLKVVQTLV